MNLYDDFWTKEIEAEVAALQGPILVVGAGGFIGAKLFFSLAQRRKDVFAASRNPRSSWRFASLPEFISPNQLVEIDLTDVPKLDQEIARLKPKTVFNLSAYGAYERQQNVRQIHEVNYLGTLNLILALREIGCEALVQAGSSSEYGLNCTFPDETSELVPNSDYAASKVATSYLLKFYGTIHNVPCADLRLYSIYGPWEERDRLIPRLVSLGLQGQYPPLANPETSRDFVYVDDATHAFVRTALRVCQKSPGTSLNIATGTKTTLAQVAGAAKSVFGLAEDAKFGNHAARKWDLSNWYGNPARAIQAMDWKATTSFEEGLRRTGEWEKQAQPFFKTVQPVAASKTVSMVIACYRDNQAIPVMYERIVKVFEALKPRGYNYEIVFVNDCSPSGDEDEIRKICATDVGVVGVTHSRNFGSQSAFLSGLGICTGDAAVLMDGDLQDPPEMILQMVEAWEKGSDVVYGERVKRDAPLHMQFFYKAFYRVFANMSEVKIPVDAGDFSLLNRKAIEHLLKFPERDIFLRGLRAWVGFKQSGVPYVRPERAFGVTTNSFLKNIWWAKKALFSFSTKPLAYIQGVSVAMFGLTMLAGLFYLLNYFLHPPENASGITTVVLLILALGGVQLFSLSILGDYLGKVLEEVKGRPRYIRNRLVRGTRLIESNADIEDYVHKAREVAHGKHH
jgi:polyisoprenyl-phosphate glycosyltransferase